MLRHVLVLASFCASFFIQPTLAEAAHRAERVVRLPAITVTASRRPQARWTDMLVCAVAAYLPSVAQRCNAVAAIAWQRTVDEARMWARQVLDEYRRVMTEVQQHPTPSEPIGASS